MRESTNRPNLWYLVQRAAPGPGSGLAAAAAQLVTSLQQRHQSGPEDRIIVYCPSIALVAELAGLLGCPAYTSEAGGGTAEGKVAIIEQWLRGGGPGGAALGAIVATSALGPGFDYPNVRYVVHIGAPSLMSDFAQESGRAGRGGGLAASIVLLPAAWAPALGRPLDPDREAMQLFLTQQYCSRGVMN